MVVVPVGLDAAVRSVTGRGLGDSKPALEFTGRLLQQLRNVLHADGRVALLDTCLDGPPAPAAAPLDDVTGLTPWDAAVAPRGQLRAAGALHALAEGGTAALVLPPDALPSAEEFAEWLQFAWRQTDVVRLRSAVAGGAAAQSSVRARVPILDV